MSEDSDKLLLQTVRKISFDEDFLCEDAEGEDLTELSLLLTTLSRSAAQCAEVLGVGSLQALASWEPGRSLHLQRRAEGFEYARNQGVSGWEDLEELPVVEAFSQAVILEQTRPEIRACLRDLAGVDWAGIREFETSNWDICSPDSHVGSESTQTATKLVLQLDALLKGSGSPRSRIRLDFEQGSLWSWSNRQDDYLMVLSTRDIDVSQRASLMRAGEAFMSVF